MRKLLLPVLVLSTSLLAAQAASAGVGEIIGPEVTKDQFEAQYHFNRTHDDKASKHNNLTHRLEFESLWDLFPAPWGVRYVREHVHP